MRYTPRFPTKPLEIVKIRIALQCTGVPEVHPDVLQCVSQSEYANTLGPDPAAPPAPVPKEEKLNGVSHQSGNRAVAVRAEGDSRTVFGVGGLCFGFCFQFVSTVSCLA